MVCSHTTSYTLSRMSFTLSKLLSPAKSDFTSFWWNAKWIIYRVFSFHIDTWELFQLLCFLSKTLSLTEKTICPAWSWAKKISWVYTIISQTEHKPIEVSSLFFCWLFFVSNTQCNSHELHEISYCLEPAFSIRYFCSIVCKYFFKFQSICHLMRYINTWPFKQKCLWCKLYSLHKKKKKTIFSAHFCFIFLVYLLLYSLMNI